MNTSCFKYFYPNEVSIARFTPEWFVGDTYIELAPPTLLLKAYRSGGITDEDYTKIYYKFVLTRLDPWKVYKDLKDAVLMCYEPSGFCHRHLVSRWIYDNVGVEVKEIP